MDNIKVNATKVVVVISKCALTRKCLHADPGCVLMLLNGVSNVNNIKILSNISPDFQDPLFL